MNILIQLIENQNNHKVHARSIVSWILCVSFVQGERHVAVNKEIVNHEIGLVQECGIVDLIKLISEESANWMYHHLIKIHENGLVKFKQITK